MDLVQDFCPLVPIILDSRVHRPYMKRRDGCGDVYFAPL
jgi:hypothetical protein